MLKVFKMATFSKAILAPTIPYIASFTCLRWSRWRSVAEVGGGGRWRRSVDVGGGGRRRRSEVAEAEVGGGGRRRRRSLMRESELIVVQ